MLGSKIKALRQKNDLTQEKLADYLCVSYQAVSKWECGISNPDLSMIAPLARLFRVSADELLGLNEPETDERRAALEAAHESTWKTGDLAQRHLAAAALVKEYPGEMKYLDWLAWTTAMRSFEYKDDHAYAAEQEKAIKLFATVIENATDDKTKNSAILGITQYLQFRGRKEEARTYADLYPEKDATSKDQLLLHCLSGDERKKHWQQMNMDRLVSLLDLLTTEFVTVQTKKLEEDLLKLFFPDENYIYFHFPLFRCLKSQAQLLLQEQRTDEAIAIIKRALFHAMEYDKIDWGEQVHKYTAPMFDMLEYDTAKAMRSGTGTLAAEFYEWLENEMFDSLRERGDLADIVCMC